MHLSVFIYLVPALLHFRAYAHPSRSTNPQLLRRGICCSRLPTPDEAISVTFSEQSLEDDDVGTADVEDFYLEDLPPTGSTIRTIDPSVYSMSNADKTQYSFNFMSYKGGPERLKQGKKGIWENASIKGASTRSVLDKYVKAGRRRIDDYPVAQRPKDISVNYVMEKGPIFDAADKNPEIPKTFKDLNIELKGPKPTTYYQTQVYTRDRNVNKRPSDAPQTTDDVLVLAINPEAGAMVVKGTYNREDVNEAANKLYSSELIWQVWAQKSVEIASAPDSGLDSKTISRNARYILHHDVVNQETENVMRLVHQLGAQGVYDDGTKYIDQIPPNPQGGPSDPENGIGYWRNDNVFFEVLLSTPNVRPIAQMLADHNTELDNPYIAAIHTLPRRTSRDVGIRQAYVVIELGPSPFATQGSIETS